MFKFDESNKAWTKIVTSFTNNVWGADHTFYHHEPIVLVRDDGLHLYPRNNNGKSDTDLAYHTQEDWLWDGSTWTRLADLPYILDQGGAVELNGEMHYIGCRQQGSPNNTPLPHLKITKVYKEV
jgi:hypothetical protein